ncbi:hypothetical protein BB561_002144 [Smittium simulii]|uniref:Cytokinin riboside 5'-monophosphate phosphoribohydrolase n=1 Tax=Smittium simulii TaxID=133385 RepID=A0A2T9YRG8_9FUNG|nr:hypothetical protein BB561_002144 [Smittium simulii]
MLQAGDYVCVFCGSRTPTNTNMVRDATELGEKLAANKLNLVYGGGGSGMMGLVASAANKAGSHVLGIIPSALIRQEHNNSDIVETVVVTDMHTRKQKMNERAAAFVILPGGFGTFEEFLEITTWSLLSIHSKPIIVVNTDGFYDPMKILFQNAVEAGFISEENKALVVFANTIEETINALHSYTAPTTRYKLDWSQTSTDLI